MLVYLESKQHNCAIIPALSPEAALKLAAFPCWWLNPADATKLARQATAEDISEYLRMGGELRTRFVFGGQMVRGRITAAYTTDGVECVSIDSDEDDSYAHVPLNSLLGA